MLCGEKIFGNIPLACDGEIILLLSLQRIHGIIHVCNFFPVLFNLVRFSCFPRLPCFRSHQNVLDNSMEKCVFNIAQHHTRKRLRHFCSVLPLIYLIAWPETGLELQPHHVWRKAHTYIYEYEVWCITCFFTC